MGLRFTDQQLQRSYDRVREELCEVGLLEDGHYLDDIWISPHYNPLAFVDGEYGHFYDEGVNFWSALVGFEPSTIYIFAGAPINAYVPGGTLVDVIRHEFGHAWAWRDPAFFRKPWFRQAFGAAYTEERWEEPDEFDPDLYVSEYACQQAKEDFAETFMVYLRHRRNLSRFKARAGVMAKLRAVEQAVAEAARTRIRIRRRSQR